MVKQELKSEPCLACQFPACDTGRIALAYDLPSIANAALCREHTPLALRQAAIALGVLDAIDVAWTPWTPWNKKGKA